MQRLFRRLAHVESIGRRLRLSFRMLVILLVVPAIVSIAAMLANSVRYDAIIARMGRVGDLKPLVAVDIPGEAWNVVAGNQRFEDSRLFAMLDEISGELDALMASTDSDNQLELTVARRTMDTLREKVVELGLQIEGGAPDKVLYYRMADDSLRGFRVHAGDMLLTVPDNRAVDGALMLIEYKGRRLVRKTLKMDGMRLQMQAFDREFESVIAPAPEVKILGRCVRLVRNL